MDQYNDLNHSGVLGMKWGRRKSFKKEARYKKSQDLKKEGDAFFEKSKIANWQRNQIKKHGSFDSDAEPFFQNDKNFEKAEKLYADANTLHKDYKKAQVIGTSIVSSMYLAPIAMIVANSVSKSLTVKGSKKAAIVLSAGLGSVAVNALIAERSATNTQNKVAKKYNIS